MYVPADAVTLVAMSPTKTPFLYSAMLTFEPPLCVHVMFCEVPACQTCPPLGAVREIVEVSATVYAANFVPDWPEGLVTSTLYVPAARAGTITVSCVALFQMTDEAAVPPIITVAPFTKLLPVMMVLCA